MLAGQLCQRLGRFGNALPASVFLSRHAAELPTSIYHSPSHRHVGQLSHRATALHISYICKVICEGTYSFIDSIIHFRSASMAKTVRRKGGKKHSQNLGNFTRHQNTYPKLIYTLQQKLIFMHTSKYSVTGILNNPRHLLCVKISLKHILLCFIHNKSRILYRYFASAVGVNVKFSHFVYFYYV